RHNGSAIQWGKVMTPKPIATAHLDGIAKQALETGRNRLLVGGALFAVAFSAIAFRLADVTVVKPAGEPTIASAPTNPVFTAGRADIVDRNGVVLATSLNTASLYANPGHVLDAREAADRLHKVLPELRPAELLGKLTSQKSFVWIKRHLNPRQHYAVHRLGIPGLYFQREERRVYPQGRLFSHLLGFAGTDGIGLTGVEKKFNAALGAGSKPLRLSVDSRLQHILRQELMAATRRFRADGACGVVMDTTTGEVLAMVSLPDFDPNAPDRSPDKARFNRATLGVYEMGSTFKVFTTAMALDSGTVGIRGGFDASKPIKIARFSITDFHPKNRWLSVPEIFMYSSNIGTAKMAMKLGTGGQREYLGRLGLLRPANIEVPEVGAPLVPSPWREINTVTISYGHGIAVSPVQTAQAVAAIVNGGILRQATLLKPLKGETPKGQRVLKTETSRSMRKLLRLVVTAGTGRKGHAPGYIVGGKTGTAEKTGARGYQEKALVSSFVAAFPMTAPRYVVFAVVDEPHGNKRTLGYATGGWVAAPVVSRFIRRAGPLLGIAPMDEDSPSVQRALAIDIPTAARGIRGRTLASF
ncbi:MAG TPA: penicillin-binding protein 2, partial [Alphaproteobacteria bacterium]|nr:penicillin-binding protein 2 [Alphaproteobacteria bacterium]